jgi:copper chaperone
MVSTTFRVAGMTCAHCVSAVSDELAALAGVIAVDIDLNADDISLVTVTSHAPLARGQVESALDEAGDYRLTATSTSATTES